MGFLLAGAALGATVDVHVTDAKGGALEDAVVVLDALDTSPPPDHRSAVIDQVNQQFVPRVAVIRTGTSMSFPNSDRVRHQVYSFSKAKNFTLKLYAGSPQTPVLFDKPGLIVLGCNIHDSMVGFLAVVDTPYFAKSNAAGAAQIKVPLGHYRLRAWHENQTKPFSEKKISVDTDAVNLAVPLDIAPTPGIPAPWIE